MPEAESKLRELAQIRHRSIHFNPDVDTNDRAIALSAINLLQQIINLQFGVFGGKPWILFGTGVTFIKREWENNPFVKEIYLPNCQLVGPNHTMHMVNNVWSAQDIEYEAKEISDEEFINLFNGRSVKQE